MVSSAQIAAVVICAAAGCGTVFARSILLSGWRGSWRIGRRQRGTRCPSYCRCRCRAWRSWYRDRALRGEIVHEDGATVRRHAWYHRSGRVAQGNVGGGQCIGSGQGTRCDADVARVQGRAIRNGIGITEGKHQRPNRCATGAGATRRLKAECAGLLVDERVDGTVRCAVGGHSNRRVYAIEGHVSLDPSYREAPCAQRNAEAYPIPRRTACCAEVEDRPRWRPMGPGPRCRRRSRRRTTVSGHTSQGHRCRHPAADRNTRAASGWGCRPR